MPQLAVAVRRGARKSDGVVSKGNKSAQRGGESSSTGSARTRHANAKEKGGDFEVKARAERPKAAPKQAKSTYQKIVDDGTWHA